MASGACSNACFHAGRTPLRLASNDGVRLTALSARKRVLGAFTAWRGETGAPARGHPERVSSRGYGMCLLYKRLPRRLLELEGRGRCWLPRSATGRFSQNARGASRRPRSIYWLAVGQNPGRRGSRKRRHSRVETVRHAGVASGGGRHSRDPTPKRVRATNLGEWWCGIPPRTGQARHRVSRPPDTPPTAETETEHDARSARTHPATGLEGAVGRIRRLRWCAEGVRSDREAVAVAAGRRLVAVLWRF